MPTPVTLSSDFGRYYPAAMRGVLAKRGIDEIHDVTHELPAHDIRESAFWLHTLLPFFPRAVHCIVIDPGVGGERDVVILRAGGHALVGPDNGVCWPAASTLADTETVESFVFEHVDPESHTFHGRDVFAPVAAAIASVGIDRIEELPTVKPAESPKQHSLPTPRTGDDWIETEIIATDRFGNAITGASGSLLDIVGEEAVAVDGDPVPVGRRYGAVEIGDRLVTVGSHGHIELAANQAAGTDAFGVDVGDTVRISRV